MNLLSSLENIELLVKYIEKNSINEIIKEVAKLTNSSIDELCNRPMGGYSKGRTSGAYYFVLNDLKDNIYKYEWLYHRLADKYSKEVLLNLLRYRLTSSLSFIKNAFDGINPQYFDKSIIKCDENEVFVDCGAYIGDTVESYIENYNKYKKIYSYEPSNENFEKCIKNTQKYKNIEVRPFGVGECNKKVYFTQTGSSSSIRQDENSEVINIVSIDEDIKEKITYLKMDVECEEINAIKGAENHIKNDSPKLAICLYHIVSDLWEIPELIDSINCNYDFYIRHYEESVAWETVLYAVPKNKIAESNNKKGFYLIPYIENYIDNVRITKDVCLIPYFMYKLRNYNSVVVSEKDEYRPYLEKYTKGLKIELTNQNLSFHEGILNFIAENYKKIDVLMLFGPYYTYFDKLNFYKRLRPDGKVYLKMDANSGWMDRIDFNNENVKDFFEKIDVVSVESKTMKKFLSSKIPYKKIEYIPNGYYDYFKTIELPKYEEKENTILTVGRIGTYQKNNEVLLEAFKLVANEIPDWNLKLVGPIEKDFYKYIENYFLENPHLKDRIIFTGNIESKEDLFEEYRKSKIFILTSVFEGFPNVYSEIALNGNYIITSDIDAAIDMTNNENIGDIFKQGDIDGLANIFLNRCNDEEYIKSKCLDIINYIKRYFDYEKTVLKIDYLLNIE